MRGSKKPIDISFNKFGPWEKVMADLKSLNITIRNSALYGQKKAVIQYYNIVKNHLINQDLPWASLKPNYLKQKHSSSTLIETGTYLSNISYWRDSYVYYIGVKQGIFETTKGGKQGLELAILASIHEYGSRKRNIAKRPLWKPSLDEMGGGQGMVNIIQDVLANKFRQMRYPIVKKKKILRKTHY